MAGVFIFSNSNVIMETANLPHMMNKNVKMTKKYLQYMP